MNAREQNRPAQWVGLELGDVVYVINGGWGPYCGKRGERHVVGFTPAGVIATLKCERKRAREYRWDELLGVKKKTASQVARRVPPAIDTMRGIRAGQDVRVRVPKIGGVHVRRAVRVTAAGLLVRGAAGPATFVGWDLVVGPVAAPDVAAMIDGVVATKVGEVARG